MRLRRAISLCALLLSASATARAEPAPGDVESARAHYKRGVQLYESGSYEAALVELERANALAPTYKLLYNLALVQTRLGDVAGALRSFTEYLATGGAEIPAARRTEVDALIADLSARVATLEVSAGVDGADVRIDGQAIGTTPLGAPVRLNPGPHRVAATKAGFASETRVIDLSAGEHATVTLRIPERETPPPPLPSPSAPVPSALPTPSPAVAAPAAPPPRRSTWIGWTITGALGAGAVATGIGALGESRKLSDEVNGRPTPAATIHATHDATIALAVASDILTVSTVAAGVVTLYFSLKSTKRDTQAVIHVTPAGLGVSGSF